MCGIVGVYNFEPDHFVDQALIKEMTNQLRHRGPDNEGYFIQRNLGLGFRRLSIIDLSEAGNQPLSNEDGTVWIIFNGEVYNFRELRASLEQRGHRFRTKTDTETVVHLYEDHGIDCVKFLNGMFAFALWDSRRSRLFVVRDRLGIKPLCYYKDAHRFVFASEIKALVVDPSIPREVNPQALHDYLHFMSVPQPETVFKGIQKLLPGHYILIEDSRVKLEQYWDIPLEQGEQHSDAYYTEELERLFQQAVRRQLTSDVPLGAFLSGGVDSSSVVAMMKEARQSVKTFSITFKGETIDESRHAQTVARHLNTEHREFNVAPDLVDTLPKLAWYLDEPFAVPAAFATYFLSKTTRNEVTVALSGDGGDELFAGYSYRLHLDETLRRYRWLPLPMRIVLRGATAMIPAFGSHALRESLINLKRFTGYIAHTPDDAYLQALSLFDEQQKTSLYAEKMENHFLLQSSSRLLNQHYGDHTFASTLQKRLYADLKTNLVDEMLTKVDKMSMAASLEVRVPFLDHELVEFAFKIPDHLKLQGKQGKIILKRMMEKYLPKEILYRRKQGFSVPVDRWFRNELYELIQDVLSDQALNRHAFFNTKRVRKMIRDHKNYRANFGVHLYALLSFQLWYDTFIHR